MQGQSQSRVKIERHMTNIRRDARYKILQHMRNKMYFQTRPISEIAEGFGLPSKEQGEYTILQILAKCYEQIIKVKRLIVVMKEQSSSIQKQETSLNAHINFWAYLLQQFFTEKLQLFEDMQRFFSQFLQNITYKQLAIQKLLQLKVLNTLQIALVPGKASWQFKKTCLEWAAGTEALTLINNSLLNKFLPPDQYQNVYQILKQSLKFHSQEKLGECCQIVKQIMKTADFDETYRIYTEQSDLIVNLVSQIERFVQISNVDQYADAVIYLMDSYNSLIFDYARMGVALMATKMIICRRECNVLKGLEIVKFISEVEETQVIMYLLEDRQLNEAGLWKNILGAETVLAHSNISIKREGFTILANLMSNGDYICSQILNQKLKKVQQRQLIHLIASSLKTQEDLTVLHHSMTIFSILLHYSQNFTQQQYHQQNQEKLNSYYSKYNGNYFLKNFIPTVLQLGIQKLICNLTQHENTQLAENANRLCNSMQFVMANKY